MKNETQIVLRVNQLWKEIQKTSSIEVITTRTIAIRELMKVLERKELITAENILLQNIKEKDIEAKIKKKLIEELKPYKE